MASKKFAPHTPKFSPKEICRLVGVSRTSLFRLEKNGALTGVTRENKERCYDEAHLRKLGELRLAEKYKECSLVTEKESDLRELHVKMMHLKLRTRDATAIAEFEQMESPDPETIHETLAIAGEIFPSVSLPFYRRIVLAAANHLKTINQDH